MRNPFKKRVNTFQVAAQIAMSVSDEVDYIQRLVDRYCEEDERLKKYITSMLDESQWLADACGIAVIAIHNPGSAAEVVKDLMKVYLKIDQHNGGGTMFSEEKMKQVFPVILEYLQEFLKGIREEGGNDKAFNRGLIYLCDVYSQRVFNGYPEPGSAIDRYIQELSQHFFVLFNNKFE